VASVTESDSPLFKGYKSIILYYGNKKRTSTDEAFTLTHMPKILAHVMFCLFPSDYMV
jgi:hypothetical protein